MRQVEEGLDIEFGHSVDENKTHTVTMKFLISDEKYQEGKKEMEPNFTLTDEEFLKRLEDEFVRNGL